MIKSAPTVIEIFKGFSAVIRASKLGEGLSIVAKEGNISNVMMTGGVQVKLVSFTKMCAWV